MTKVMKMVTAAQFEIEVEKEFEFLVYQERMSKAEALPKARKAVAEKYEVEKPSA